VAPDAGELARLSAAQLRERYSAIVARLQVEMTRSAELIKRLQVRTAPSRHYLARRGKV
jgi:hypothetical protein